ncbi:MAG: hypothetical protein Rhirs2KO_36710 [Rhizobiaceae bacterium]
MTRTGTWRLPASYGYTRGFYDMDFAWEFLRRNEEFQREARAAPMSPDAPRQPINVPARFSEETRSQTRSRADLLHWGLLFRARSEA